MDSRSNCKSFRHNVQVSREGTGGLPAACLLHPFSSPIVSQRASQSRSPRSPPSPQSPRTTAPSSLSISSTSTVDLLAARNSTAELAGTFVPPGGRGGGQTTFGAPWPRSGHSGSQVQRLGTGRAAKIGRLTRALDSLHVNRRKMCACPVLCSSSIAGSCGV